MASIKLDLRKFKAVSRDKNSTTLQHEDGHRMMLAHGKLSPENQKDLMSLPLAGETKPVKKFDQGGGVGSTTDSDKWAKFKKGYQSATADSGPAPVATTSQPQNYDEGGLAEVKASYQRKSGGIPAKPKEAPTMNNDSVTAEDAADIGEEQTAKAHHKTSPTEQAAQASLNKGDDEPAGEAHFADGGDVEDSSDDANKPVTININGAGAQVAPPAALANPNPGSQAQTPMGSQMSPTQQAASNPGSQPYGTTSPDDAEDAQQAKATIPPQSPGQSPVAPPSGPQIPQGGVPGQTGLNAVPGYENQSQGITNQAKAEGALGSAHEAAYDKQAQDMFKLSNTYNAKVKEIDQERQALQADIANSHIDPNHYLGSMDTPQRISTAVGLILGGIGAGFGNGPNSSLQMLNNQIDRDIDAQKANLGKKENLLSATMRQYGNLKDATDMTKMMMMDTTMAKLQSATANAQDPLAKARGQQALGQLQTQLSPMATDLAMRRTLSSTNSEGGQASSVDPAMLVPLMIKDPSLQKAAFEEIKNAKNVGANGPKILEAFDNGAKENTVMKTGAGILRTPGSVMALHQLMLPNFKTIDGTVRQAAMDETFHNVTPQPGDSDAKIQAKRQALQDWLHSETASPVSSGHYIDLSKYASTSTDPTTHMSPQNRSIVKWARDNPTNPKSKQALEALGVK